jgi:hypothetical protein
LINQIEDQRLKIIQDSERIYLNPMLGLIEKIGKVINKDKKEFSKESRKFYDALDKNLHLNTVLFFILIIF